MFEQGLPFDPVFVGSDDGLGVESGGLIEQALELVWGVGSVVGADDDIGNVGHMLSEHGLEGVRIADAADGEDAFFDEVRHGKVGLRGAGHGAGFPAGPGHCHVGERGTAGEGGDALVEGVEVRRSDLIGAGEDDVMGSAEGGEGLAKQASGQESFVAEGVGRIEEDQVEVAVGLSVLEAVVEDEDRDVGVGVKRLGGTGSAGGVDVDGGVWA